MHWGHNTFTFQANVTTYVTTSVTWLLDSHLAIWYTCSIVTKYLSPAVSEIMGIKHIGVTTEPFRVTWLHQSRNHWTRDGPFPVGVHWTQVSISNGFRDIPPQTPCAHRRNTESRSWPKYIWGPLSRKRLEIQTWFQWTTNRKWPIEIRMVTYLMTSRDPMRSWSWPQYTWGPLSRQRLEIRACRQWRTYRKWLPGYQMIRDRWRHVTLKGESCDI